MRFNKTVLAMIMLGAVLSIGIAAAQQANVSGHTFTVPNGYHVENTTANEMTLKKDAIHKITLNVIPKHASMTSLRPMLEKEGFELVGEDSYSLGIHPIEQQNYKTDGLLCMIYYTDAGNDSCVITNFMPESEFVPSGSANPVSTIISTID